MALFQRGNFLWEMTTLSFTVKNQAMDVCNLQTQILDKVKQSTSNQFQERLQELYFQERHHTFFTLVSLERQPCQTEKGHSR